MKKGIIILIILFSINSCKKLNKENNDNNCMSHATLFFYSNLTDDYIPLFNKWENSLTDSVKIKFCEDVKEIINTIDQNTVQIYEQTGGVHPNQYRLLRPCRKGGQIIKKLFMHSDFEKKIKLQLDNINVKYRGKGFDETLGLITHLVKTGFIDQSCYFNFDHLNSTPYAELVLELLIYQHTLYLFMHKNL